MIGHSALWPRYRRKGERKHGLALDDGERIFVFSAYDAETKSVVRVGEYLAPETYGEWRAIVTRYRLDVFCRRLFDFRFLTEAINHAQDTVSLVKNSTDFAARPVSVSCRAGNSWGSLREGATWEDGTDPSPDFLARLSDTFLHLGAGTYPSPGSLGQATMRQMSSGRYTAPGGKATTDLRDGLVGGRADEFEDGKIGEAYEYDRNAAYLAECLEPLPVGTAIRLLGDTLDDLANDHYTTWYVRCTVIIQSILPVGPFPFRDERKGMRYPVFPGTYQHVWLWRHEIEASQEAGCVVWSEGEGWAWEHSEPVLRDWARWIWEKRETAEPRVKPFVKKTIVAAIGWFGMSEKVYEAVPDGTKEAIDVLIDTRDGSLCIGEVIAKPSESAQMLHWCSYIWSLARVHLYERMLAEIHSGNTIVSSNFDSIVLRNRSSLDLGLSPGEWREIALSNVYIPFRRGMVSDQKVTLPGIPGEDAKEFAKQLRFGKEMRTWGMEKALLIEKSDQNALSAMRSTA